MVPCSSRQKAGAGVAAVDGLGWGQKISAGPKATL